MRIFLLFLTLAAFLQSSFLGVNLVLLLIAARSLILKDQDNYLIAFISGIILGILLTQNLGFWALVFLLVVKLIQLIKELPFTSNIVTVLPIGFLVVLISSFLEQLFFKQSINFTKIIIETLVFLPIYILIKIWEERFVVKPVFKLKLGGK